MDKIFKVAVVLTAVDQMTKGIRAATQGASAELQALQSKSSALFSKGFGQIAGGTALAASLAPAVNAFATLEDSSTRLETAMMHVGGVTDESFSKVNKLAIDLGNKLPGTTADFQNMFEVMLNNGIPAQTLLDGVGESAAYLAVALKMPYEEAGKFAAKMKEATGTTNSDMMSLMDTIARTRNLGVDAGEMQYAFGRSAGALKLMGIQGLDASKSLASVYAALIRAGLSGETVGTGFASVLNSMLDPKKMGAAQEAASALGVSLEFMKNGKFLGIENMIKQLDKLKSFSADQRFSVVQALTGGGQDASMLQTLISNGVEGFDKMNQAMATQANLGEKVGKQLGTLNSIWEATTGTIENMLAAFGAGIAPELKKIGELIGTMSATAQEFFSNNPNFAKFISLSIVGAGVLLTIVGVVNLIRGAWTALTVAMSLNPFMLVALAVIGVVALIYAYWEPITGFFSGIFQSIQSTVDGWVVAFREKVSGINQYFVDLGERIKTTINALGPMLYEAGANIISGLFDGMKAKFTEGIEKVKNMASEISTSFKSVLGIQSPSRVFMEHGMNITQGAVIGMGNGMGNLGRTAALAASVVASPLTPSMAQPLAGGGGGSVGGGITIQYSPQVTVGAGGTPQQAEDFANLLKQHSRELVRIVEDTIARNDRKKF